ncbi:MAG: DHA2 family efflux MFS transporter permease subunit [Actinocatenispora sp.]
MSRAASGRRPGVVVASADRDRIGWPTWRLAWVIVFGAFASGLDASLANIGLDTIRAELHTSLAEVQWVSTGYLVALAMSLPVCGWLGRRIGVGRLWLHSLAVFTVASAACAAAPGIGSLVALRAVQGLAAGLLIPAGQTILGQAVGPGRLGQVMATLGIVVTLGPALGPVVGGLVLHALSWPWLFLINVPVGAVGLLLARRVVPRGTPGTAAPLDWFGLACVVTGLPLVVYAFTTWGSTGPRAGGAPAVLVPLAVGLLSLAAFVRRTLRRRHPLMDLRLYRNPGYAAATGAATFSGAVMLGGGLLLPLYLQIVYGFGALRTGLLLLSLSGGTALALPLAGRLTDRHGGGIVAMWGSAGTVLAAAVLAILGADTHPAFILAVLAVLGSGIALAAVPPGIAAYRAVRADQLPDATTQVNIGQRLGGALGGALFAVVLARGLPDSTLTAFHVAFWWLVGAAVIGFGWSTWLWRALRAPGPAPGI